MITYTLIAVGLFKIISIRSIYTSFIKVVNIGAHRLALADPFFREIQSLLPGQMSRETVVKTTPRRRILFYQYHKKIFQ